MGIKAVLFDMDGLMFDTETLALRAWDYAGKQMGFSPDPEMTLKITGINGADARKVVETYLGSNIDHKQIFRLMEQYYNFTFQHEGIPIKEGLGELLDYLRRREIPAAVATSSGRNRTERNLELAGVSGFFGAIVCGNEVARGKPHGDIYLNAANLLGKDTKECLVLEDSPNGIKAGIDAGCVTIAIPDICVLSEELLGRCAAVLPNLREVVKFLEQQPH